MTEKPPIAPYAPDVPEHLIPFPGDQRDMATELREQHLSHLDLSGLDASDLRLEESRIEDVDLSASTLRRASMTDVVVDGGSWANADLANAALTRLEMEGVRLTGTVLSAARISDVSFVDCRIDLFVNCDLAEANLAETTFARCEMRGCHLEGIGDPERLRGVGMPWPDILRAAATLAAAAGVHVVAEDDGTT